MKTVRLLTLFVALLGTTSWMNAQIISSPESNTESIFLPSMPLTNIIQPQAIPGQSVETQSVSAVNTPVKHTERLQKTHDSESETNEKLAKQYTEILEKTNQQLGLWSNPYGILVGALAVLFATLAIIAAVVLFMLSKEQRDRIEAVVEDHRKVLSSYQEMFNKLVADNKELFSKLVADTNANLQKKHEELIEQYQTQLKTATGEQKKELEKKLAAVVAEKSSFIPRSTQEYVTPELETNYFTTGSISKVHKCSTCGFGYRIQPSLNTYIAGSYPGLYGQKQTIQCPRCGNIEFYAPTY